MRSGAMTFGFQSFSWNTLDATGPDVLGWLGGIVTCDLPTGPADGARWGLLLSKQGKVQAELVVTAPAAGALSIAVRGGDAHAARTVLDHHLVMEDVELGPVQARPFGILLEPSADDLAAVTGAGVEVWAAPGPFASERGVLVRGPGTLPELTSALSGRGRELAPAEWDDARIGIGLPIFGVDFDDNDNPHQASLERRAVSWNKGCYLGQEVVFMQDARGKVKRRLVRLVGASSAVLPAGAHVSSEAGEDVGFVTTAGAGRALAKVSAPHFEVGSSLRIGDLAVAVEALDAGLFGRTGRPDRIPR